jgi:hypothetical protein
VIVPLESRHSRVPPVIAETHSKNRVRLLEGDIAAKFLCVVLGGSDLAANSDWSTSLKSCLP